MYPMMDTYASGVSCLAGRSLHGEDTQAQLDILVSETTTGSFIAVKPTWTNPPLPAPT